jgi:hypothetical protein
MRYVAVFLGLLTGLPGIAAAPPAFGAGEPVDLELVLAVDVSGSMDFYEQHLQRSGYVSAFRHPDVITAIGIGAHGRIAVTYIEWAGPFLQTVTVPWRIIADRDGALAFAAELEAAPITSARGTSISDGLMFAASLFGGSDTLPERRAIDVSGDGPNNMGFPVVPIRDEIVADGITINGLPILIRPTQNGGPSRVVPLDIYYEDCVIGGPGAFMITVDDPSRFELAIRRKLVLEIAALAPQVIPAQLTYRPEPRVDCLIGERSRGGFFFFEPTLR